VLPANLFPHSSKDWQLQGLAKSSAPQVMVLQSEVFATQLKQENQCT